MNSGSAVSSSPNSSMTTSRCGSGGRSGRSPPQLAVVGDDGDLPASLQQLLAAHAPRRGGWLCTRSVSCGSSARLLISPATCGRPLERGERGATLVVDQHHAQVLRRVGERQRQDEGAQQLALAGAGGADAEAVRAHAELRGLLEVEQHRRPAVVDPDRYPEEVPQRSAAATRRGRSGASGSTMLEQVPTSAGGVTLSSWDATKVTRIAAIVRAVAWNSGARRRRRGGTLDACRRESLVRCQDRRGGRSDDVASDPHVDVAWLVQPLRGADDDGDPESSWSGTFG